MRYLQNCFAGRGRLSGATRPPDINQNYQLYTRFVPKDHVSKTVKQFFLFLPKN